GLTKTITKVHLSYANFKSHSFRIARATQLALDGVPDSEIQRMGRWTSDSYKTYIHIWIIGDSLVTRAGQPHSGSGGRCLKVDGFNIQWLGFPGVQWKDLLPKFQLKTMSSKAPRIIVINLGGNDLSSIE
ncbi:hypothetical protein MAR_013070, partial [Mya arenaria]